MFNLVAIGRADAAVTGKPAAKLFAQKNPGFKVLDEQITTEAYGIAVSKNEPELTKEFNQALKTIKANGTYQKIVDKWFEGKK
jgi:polar amino acid transport system substrate-binding protein